MESGTRDEAESGAGAGRVPGELYLLITSPILSCGVVWPSTNVLTNGSVSVSVRRVRRTSVNIQESRLSGSERLIALVSLNLY